MNKKDKIKGMLFGYALGDALGIGTELMTQREVAIRYPEGLHSFSQMIRDWHRCQWERGDWSNDTETLLLLVDSLLDSNGVDINDYARRLKTWYEQNPAEPPTVFRCVIPEPHWEENPLTVARNVWHREHLSEATNEALQRALISGIASGDDILEDTRNLVQITHNDSRCVSSAMVIARMAQALLWEDKEAEYDELVAIADALDHRTIVFLQIARNGSFEDIKLDDEDTRHLTRKTMAAALWALWHCDSPAKILDTIISAGGAADTNAALGLAIAGLKYGYHAMPVEVKNLIQYERVDQEADRLYEFIQSKNNPL